MIHSFSAKAAATSIKCETAFGEKSFTIEDNRVSFHKEDEAGVSRSISSVQGESVRTHVKHLGFSKTLYIDGNKHRMVFITVDVEGFRETQVLNMCADRFTGKRRPHLPCGKRPGYLRS